MKYKTFKYKNYENCWFEVGNRLLFYKYREIERIF